MNDMRLIEWLINNSSGCYRPAEEAAHRIIELKEATNNILRDIISQSDDEIDNARKMLEVANSESDREQSCESKDVIDAMIRLKDYINSIDTQPIIPEVEGKLRCRIQIYDPSVKEAPYEFITLKENVFVDVPIMDDFDGAEQAKALWKACNDLGYVFKSYSVSDDGVINITVYGGLTPLMSKHECDMRSISTMSY